MKTTLFIITTCVLITNSCDPMDKVYSIKVENRTNNTIMASAGCSKYHMSIYPDTLLPPLKPFLIRVNSNDYNYLDHSFKWEDVVSELPSDTLSIYIFDSDTVDIVPWPTVKSKYLVLKRYDLSLEDLKGMNWIITYP